MAERRSRSWWKQTVSRWKSSGLSAREFAAREGLSARTLSWWTSMLRRGTRASRGSGEVAVAPIEIELPHAKSAGDAYVEIAVGGVVIRVEVGADIDYVAALVRRLGAAR